MNKRAYFGYGLWALSFDLAVAVSAFYLGLGISFTLFTLRHILLGIPKVFELWWLVVFGHENIDRLTQPKRQWPDRHWMISGLIYIGVTIIVLLKFNIRLIDVIRGQ